MNKQHANLRKGNWPPLAFHSTPIKIELFFQLRRILLFVPQLLVTSIALMSNYVLSHILDIIRTHGRIDYYQTGHNYIKMDVDGTGIVAYMARMLIKTFEHKKFLNQQQSNAGLHKNKHNNQRSNVKCQRSKVKGQRLKVKGYKNDKYAFLGCLPVPQWTPTFVYWQLAYVYGFYLATIVLEPYILRTRFWICSLFYYRVKQTLFCLHLCWLIFFLIF